MKKIEQRIERPQPSRLEVYREIDKRSGLSEEAKKELKHLEAGHLGESIVREYLEEFGEPHWLIKTNFWFDYYGKTEVDLLLITSTGVVAFEIKYFSGVYEFKSGQCLRNGTKIGRNPISQAQRTFINFQNMLKQNGFDISVVNTLLFAGQHYDIKVHDEMEDLKIVMLHQLRDYIWKIART